MVLKRYFENLEPALEKLDDKKHQLVFDTILSHWSVDISKNKLAIFRIVAAVAIFISLFDFKHSNALAFLLFTLGMSAGYINEVLQSNNKETSAFAKMIDPLTDRALIIPLAGYLLTTSNTPLLAAMILMEICNAFITISIEDGQTPYQSNTFGRSKTLFQAIGCIGLLLFWRVPFFNILFVTIIWFSLLLFMLSMRQKIFGIATHHAHQTHANQNLQYALKEERTVQAN